MTDEQLQAWLGRNAQGFLSLLLDHEIRLLHDYAADPNLPSGHILELGTFLGSTTLGLADANELRGVKGEQVVAIDNHPMDIPMRPAWALMSVMASRLAKNTSLFIGTLKEFMTLSSWVVPTFRMCFLDARHSYIGIWEDVRDAAVITKPGGVIIVHDIAHHTEPQYQQESFKAWAEIARQGVPARGGVWYVDGPPVGTSGILRFKIN